MFLLMDNSQPMQEESEDTLVIFPKSKLILPKAFVSFIFLRVKRLGH